MTKDSWFANIQLLPSIDEVSTISLSPPQCHSAIDNNTSEPVPQHLLTMETLKALQL